MTTMRDRRSVYPTPQFTVCPDFSDAAKLGDTGKIDGFKRPDRMMQPSNSEDSPQADLDRVAQHEHAISPRLEGRS